MIKRLWKGLLDKNLEFFKKDPINSKEKNNMNPSVQIMKSDNEIMFTYQTFKQLRPHLKEEDFVERIKRLQRTHGFQLVAVMEDDEVKAIAGYRITESLAWGKYLYVDDLTK
jgi:hypothetical protein